MSAENKNSITRYKGKITCNRSILLSIINLATKEICGVSSLSSSFKSKFKSFFSNNKNPGVTIRFNTSGALTVDVYIRIYYGYGVPDIAYKIQENIKNGIAAMVDMKTAKVNVHVMGVDFEPETTTNVTA
ncbi:MAG: Asp23/Gls24 family envelope stress response protein [Clostridia bacterium]|nr:Asp23/Gls24 family envelope stress response protein [Clostridia bacterium]